jgi:rhodanese-related sulfurtransferase
MTKQLWIIGVAVLLLVGWGSGCLEESHTIAYVRFYTNVSVAEAVALINSSGALTIVDCRGCKCNYEKGHLPNAIWENTPHQFYNMTGDLLVYSQEGNGSAEFCEQLVNHTYGALYNLAGGYTAWKREGLPTTINADDET